MTGEHGSDRGARTATDELLGAEAVGRAGLPLSELPFDPDWPDLAAAGHRIGLCQALLDLSLDAAATPGVGDGSRAVAAATPGVGDGSRAVLAEMAIETTAARSLVHRTDPADRCGRALAAIASRDALRSVCEQAFLVGVPSRLEPLLALRRLVDDDRVADPLGAEDLEVVAAGVFDGRATLVGGV